MQSLCFTHATVCVLVEPGVRARIRGAAGSVTSTITSSPPPTLRWSMSSGEAWTRSTPIRAKRRVPWEVIRSPQFIASFSNWALGSTPVSFGWAPSRTSYTRSESSPDVTNTGALRRKQPEMPV